MCRLIYVDTRQKKDHHKLKHRWLQEHGFKLIRQKLDYGDYAFETVKPNRSVDTKANILEITSNITRDHGRFKNELVRAKNDGCQLYILVENVQGYKNIDDLNEWTNTLCLKCSYLRHCNPLKKPSGKCWQYLKHKLVQGPRVARTMHTLETRYGVIFEFSHPNDAGRKIVKLLGGMNGGKS